MLALLDFDEFHDVLLDATRDLLLGIRREYENKQLYAFYLFHDAPWGFIVPHIAVEDGIKQLPMLGQMVRDIINTALRTAYYLPLSNGTRMDKQPYNMNSALPIGRDYFESVNMWLLRAQFHRVTFTHKQMEQYHRTLTSICIDVLQALDKRGLFGEDAVRLQTIVNLVMMNDPNREYIQNGRDLNPPEVYQRWIEGLDIQT